VAVLTSEGIVTRIMKRRVPVALIVRNKKIVDEMDKRGKKLEEAALVPKVPPEDETGEVTYNPSDWELYCPFSSSRLTEDYSARYSRNQVILIIFYLAYNIEIETLAFFLSCTSFHLLFSILGLEEHTHLLHFGHFKSPLFL
jgi:hypothetical protein